MQTNFLSFFLTNVPFFFKKKTDQVAIILFELKLILEKITSINRKIEQMRRNKTNA